ncbi:hypothetical protein SOCE26_085330 [Sorangium cellulosum]|uniref:PIN domain-containing protein n=1 Tax=Sorangium cellulosum TaxID=56 RepID=A0A2L0F668_SORCE|nr:hypothetical protein [Sorangium cellulosum]AUX47022.1 hypothetical protein SOCE26_085330 [Sorangium cellulosum]
MRAKVSRRLVIDASVARAAGGEGAAAPLPKQCRDFLKTMLAVRHHVVLTPAVSAEWKKHASGFAMQWRTAMVARKLSLYIDVPEDVELRDALDSTSETERDRRAMLKDAHLVEAAQATDRTVVSLDERVRALFAAASERVRALKSVVWANPGREAEACPKWLEDGAPPHPHRRLGARRAVK